ncbi:MAG TPA: hypothetical protein V6C72_05410 [Chroococcales cyanobacterium]
MNTRPQYESDPRDRALDLDGLEGLLEQAHMEVVSEGSSESSGNTKSENELILKLLNQLCLVNELVKDTSERLVLANERLTSLAALVTTQNKQIELLNHYQAQAARATSLENQLAIIKLENERLKKPLWRKIMFWLK